MTNYAILQFSHSLSSGSGLGLTITQKIIEAHNGTIKVNSKINEGTTFTLQLPLKQETMSQ